MPIDSGPVLLSSLETIDLIRDIVLITFLALAFLGLFVFSILAVLIYRRVARVLQRAEAILGRAETVADGVTEGFERISALAGFLNVGKTAGRVLRRIRVF